MSEVKTNTIGKDFSLKELTKFVAAPVITRLLVSFLQTMDDSLFVSRYCGQNALAAFSVAMPWFMIVDAVGMMLGAVSFHCSIKMGRKENEEAKQDFTTICLVTFVIGLIMSSILSIFIDQILLLLGETEILMPYAKDYIMIEKLYIPLVLCSYIFGGFYVIAGKPKCSMYTTIISTFCNFFFDWLFIVKMDIGIKGAAYSNLIGFSAITIFALVFYSNKKREMCFTKPTKNIWPLLKDVVKLGRTQVITSLSIALNSFISNNVSLSLAGEEFVAAYTIVNNVQFMFMNSSFGLLGSTSPIISYAYGEKNGKKLSKTFKQIIILMESLMFIIALIYFLGKGFILDLYLEEGTGENIRQMASYGMNIAPFSFVIFGFNIFIQEFFNAVSNSRISTFLSVFENIVFSNMMALCLPFIFGIKAMWYCFLIGESLTFILTLVVIQKNTDYYGLKDGNALAFNQN